MAYNRQLQEDELKRQYSPGPTITSAEASRRKQEHESQLAEGMSFGPSRALFEEINRIKDASMEFRESLVAMKDMMFPRFQY